jgi:hypothetical protein
MVLESVVAAQDFAEKAQKDVGRLKGEFGACTAGWDERRIREKLELEGKMAEAEQKVGERVLKERGNFVRAQQLQHSQETLTLMESLTDVKGVSCTH